MIEELENRAETKATAEVLHELELRGLDEPCIAAGWTRTLVAGGSTNDIDVSYIGTVHYLDARDILTDTLAKLNPANRSQWDTEGIWNAQTAYGVTHTVDNFLLYYLNSIDSIYLGSDGKLHDPTGNGFEDARTHTLRINEYDRANGRTPTPYEEVNVCLENCRRLAKFGWTPTHESVERIQEGVSAWELLNREEETYFITKLGKKYSTEERKAAQLVYKKYGWEFIFDL